MSNSIIDAKLNSIGALVEHIVSHKNEFAELALPVEEKSLGSPQSINILAHSVAVFSQKGIEHTTVQDLMDASNVSRRTFYKYFRNKFDVLETVYRFAIELSALRFKTIASDCRDIEDIVNRSVDMFFDYHVAMGSTIRMMQEYALQSESPLAKHRSYMLSEVSKVLNDELERLIGRRYEIIRIYSALWVLESASLHLLTTTACTPEDVEDCKAAIRGVLNSIFAATK